MGRSHSELARRWNRAALRERGCRSRPCDCRPKCTLSVTIAARVGDNYQTANSRLIQGLPAGYAALTLPFVISYALGPVYPAGSSRIQALTVCSPIPASGAYYILQLPGESGSGSGSSTVALTSRGSDACLGTYYSDGHYTYYGLPASYDSQTLPFSITVTSVGPSGPDQCGNVSTLLVTSAGNIYVVS